MEKNNKREFDMFDYSGKGKTMYDFIDAHLDGYLNGDFSLNSLVKHLRTFGNYILYSMYKEQIYKQQMENKYKEIFSLLVEKLTLALKMPEDNKEFQGLIMSDEKKADLLKRLQEVDPENKLGSIEEYINLLLNNNFTESYYNKIEIYTALNDIIIDSAIDVLSDEDKLATKKFFWNSIYIPEVGNRLKAKYPDRYKVQYPEWEEYEFIRRTLQDSSKFRKYDEFVQAYEENMEKKSDETAVSMSCKAKRERYVINAIIAGMDSEEQEKLMKEKNIESVVFEKPDKLDVKEGSHVWSIKLHQRPEVLLDRIAEYSPDGIENQRVIAISYGRFDYGTLIKKDGMPTFTSDELELLGITRLGKEGMQNYFVLMALKDDLIKRDKELEDFYAKVAFSDNYLTAAVHGNFRFAGSVQTFEGKPSLNATYIANTYDFDAAYYASKYSGQTPNGENLSLDEYCRSPELFIMHCDILNQLQGNKELTQNAHNRGKVDKRARYEK